MRKKPQPRYDGVHYTPIAMQNLSPDREYSANELMCKYDVAEKNADAIADEVIAILNKYMPSDGCNTQHHKDGQIHAMRLAFDKVLNKLNPII